MSTVSIQNLIQKNIASIKRIDPFADKVIAHALHCAVYDFSLTNKTWEKTEYDGPMFIYTRVDKPFCSFMIANRQSLIDFIEPVTANLKLKLERPYIFVHKPDGSITGLWFPKDQECQKIFCLLNKIIAANGNIPESLLSEISSTSTAATKQQNSSSYETKTDIIQSQLEEPVSTMTISATKLNEPQIVPSKITNFNPDAGTAMSISPLKLNSDIPNGMIKPFASLNLKKEEPSQSNTPASNGSVVGLNKEQLLQAIEHLLMNDPDFLDKIHQAYVDSLTAHLRR